MNSCRQGFLGAALGLCAVFSFLVGVGIRSCAPEHPELIPLISVELMMVGFVVTVPSIVAGFLVGYFVGPKLRPSRAALVAFLVLIVAFGIGLVIGHHGGCAPL